VEASPVSFVPSQPLPTPSSSSFSITVVPSTSSRSTTVSRLVAPAFCVPPVSVASQTRDPAGAVKL
jgi:hypothetical protein